MKQALSRSGPDCAVDYQRLMIRFVKLHGQLSHKLHRGREGESSIDRQLGGQHVRGVVVIEWYQNTSAHCSINFTLRKKPVSPHFFGGLIFQKHGVRFRGKISFRAGTASVDLGFCGEAKGES